MAYLVSPPFDLNFLLLHDVGSFEAVAVKMELWAEWVPVALRELLAKRVFWALMVLSAWTLASEEVEGWACEEDCAFEEDWAYLAAGA